ASCRTQPVMATELGNHAYDAELDDVSATGRAAASEVRRRSRASLAAIDRVALSRDSQVDAAMLSDQLAGQAFAEERLQDWAWDPLTYSDLTGGALYSLMARDFAPLADRLISAASRMEKMPALLEQTRDALEAQRVPDIHAQTYSRQHAGVLSIIDQLILPRADALGSVNRARLLAATESARAAVAEHQSWIDRDLVPRAKGDFRIGAALFDEKLKLSLSSSMPREELRQRAQADMERLRAEMFDISRTLLASQGGTSPAPPAATEKQKQAAIQSALELAYAERPPREQMFAEARRTLETTTAFVRQHDIITLPDAPVKVIEMPVFQQGVAVAYCDSPGPLDRGMDTFYAVSPIPAGWSEAQTSSFLREYNSRSIDELTIHEAMPGHYVQLWHANKHPSVLRAVLGSGTFIEGWGCYAEDVMSEIRDPDGDPLRRLINLKWALRSTSNALLDQGVHVEGWNEEDAMRFMTEAAFQEEREAAGKWTRARLSSTQLSTYYLGWIEHHALRHEAKVRWGAGFSLKRYHDAALSHGSPPVRLARALMFGEVIA
ncbi:MAG: DUF885 domain-containing protein, partial [Alphaproteobacteria bacterium]|nr:DUF885 domain-containing protein [Alphaproteobacteria bacterium]